ncbi:MAG: hypothetical protein LYZ69_02350 [Nitrososphaerales archaeon]|nr:hypothetical protein [Nitrososphaerales archaeon]
MTEKRDYQNYAGKPTASVAGGCHYGDWWYVDSLKDLKELENELKVR